MNIFRWNGQAWKGPLIAVFFVILAHPEWLWRLSRLITVLHTFKVNAFLNWPVWLCQLHRLILIHITQHQPVNTTIIYLHLRLRSLQHPPRTILFRTLPTSNYFWRVQLIWVHATGFAIVLAIVSWVERNAVFFLIIIVRIIFFGYRFQRIYSTLSNERCLHEVRFYRFSDFIIYVKIATIVWGHEQAVILLQTLRVTICIFWTLILPPDRSLHISESRIKILRLLLIQIRVEPLTLILLVYPVRTDFLLYFLTPLILYDASNSILRGH